MEVVVYADILFALNYLMDLWMILLVTAAGKLRLSVGRMTLSAAILAFYGSLIVFPQIHMAFSLGGRIAVSLLAMKILDRRAWLKATLLFWTVSAAAGGAVFALTMQTEMGRVLKAVLVNGTLYLEAEPLLLLLGIGATHLLIWGFCKSSIRKFGRERVLIPFSLTIEGEELEFTALLDTGCELTVPVLGDAMMVVDARVLEGKLPQETFSVPVSTAGGSGELVAFYPQRLVCGDARYQIFGIPAIGISQESLSSDGLYQAVVNPDMLTDMNFGGERNGETTNPFTKDIRQIRIWTQKTGALHRRERNSTATFGKGGGNLASKQPEYAGFEAGGTADLD